jgi:hypothetical protein
MPCCPSTRHRYPDQSYHCEKTPISKSSKAVSCSVAATPKPRLLDDVRVRLRLKHDSLRTEKAYRYWIRRSIHANGLRHPREPDGAAVARFFPGQCARRARCGPFPFVESALCFPIQRIHGSARPGNDRERGGVEVQLPAHPRHTEALA